VIGSFKLQFDELSYFSVEPDTYMYDGESFDPSYKGMCIFGVMAGNSSQNTYILGNAFLKNYVAVFDCKNSRIGLAIPVGSIIAVRATFSQGVVALIAISFAVLFPLFALGIYFLVKLIKQKRKQDQKNKRTAEETNLLSQLSATKDQ